MALAVSTSVLVSTRFVLATDPALSALPLADLRHYYATRDPAGLDIPSDASWVTARPMDRRTVALIEGRTGAHTAQGEDRELMHAEAIIAACVESISDLPQLVRGPDGYPVAALWEALAAHASAGLIVREIAWHIEAVSSLPKAPAQSSPSQRGEAPASVKAAVTTPATDATAPAASGTATSGTG
jgi:hypothetical protein